MKYYVLYNPLAGNKTCAEKTEKLKERYGESAEYVDMTKIESYEELFGRINSDDAIVLSGGDGTINRFVNDTAELDLPCEILYYAAGTGNDFLRDLDGVSPDEPFPLKKYIEHLPTVEVGGRSYRFLNGVGYGIDGYCCEVGDKLRETTDKPINYAGIAIKGVLFHHKPANATVTVDGVKYEYKKVWIAPTMNGRYYGGGMMATPEQDRLSETHEVTTMIWHTAGRIKTLMAFPGIFKGEHIKNDFITLHKGHEITVEFDRPCALQIDGETVLGVTSYTVHA